MGDSQNQDNAMPDTASPYEAAPGTTFSGWGKLVPLGCTVPATDLVGNVYTIGRDMKRCEVSITEYDIKPDIHKQISKIHCRISRRKIGTARKEVVILEDLSSNGTFVNGKKIGKNEYMIIDSEDEISFAAPQNKIFLFIDGAKLDFIYPKELTDKYFVTEHIGTGGFAEVYQMLHKKTCQPFALKKISKAGVPERKIFNEIGIMKKLHHECIVQMIEVLQTQTAAFIVMEYVPDGTLLDRLKRDRRLDEHLCKTVMLQLAWAVQYLHEQGVTHRDIKPENILIEDRPKNLLRVKVADFGLSKIISSITNLKTACGTLQYTAPEILEAKGMKQYTDKVDMWGLGVVLFICLSGRRPFLAKPNDTHALIKLILKGSYSISTPEWTLITSSAKLLVKKLLAVNPAERWDTKQILESDWLQLAKGDNIDELMVDLFGHSPKFPSD